MNKPEHEKSITSKTSLKESEKSFLALRGILAGYEVDLEKEREERVSNENIFSISHTHPSHQP